ncbi:MAG TPA: sulfopyruvate decarboxylase subunit beta [Methanothermococcus okinawensis]|uniref:sulfopyruvate decarboxylase n=1 Tax=Methanothermococcus okinawensis TaxID=155863 RepID=A0A833EBE9_9EURY|nr:sulfopyruvate decarboxylase subunit beta [Methanothermococcus okinawensis]
MMLRRVDAIRILMEYVRDEVVVCNLGFPSKELYHIRDRPENFYMLGSMGLCSSIALGLALSLDKKVIAIEGDGSLLMNLGTLSTIGYTQPDNLLLYIVDNSAYGSTGNQRTHTERISLCKIARACGIEAIEVSQEGDLRRVIEEALKDNKTRAIVVKVEPHNENVEDIPLHPMYIKFRFMESIKPYRKKR